MDALGRLCSCAGALQRRIPFQRTLALVAGIVVALLLAGGPPAQARPAAAAGPEGALDESALMAAVAVDLRTQCGELRKGSTGSCVSELQRLLNSRGAGLVVDGIFGPATESAVRAFQRAHHLAIDGIVGPKTKAALYAAAGPGGGSPGLDLRTSCGTLQRGATGSCVSELQRLLNSHGAHLAVDGAFGPATESAVRAFQQARHLAVDGVVGPQTKAALYGQSAPSPPGGTVSGSAVVAAAMVAVNRHIPYSWGGGHSGSPGPSHGTCDGYHGSIVPCPANSTVGLDCSGLVRWAYWQAAHIDLSGNTDAQYGSPHAVHIRESARRPGDLVFYGTPGDTHHVAIYAGMRNGVAMMIEEYQTGTNARLTAVRGGGLWVHIR